MVCGKKITLVLRCAFSIGLLGYLISWVEWSDLTTTIGRTHPGYYLLALATGGGAVVLSAFKWQALLAAEGRECRLGELVRYYLIGIYFNNFLPTSFGGDAARVYLLSQKYGDRKAPLLSVLAERVSGLLALILLLCIGLATGPRVLGREPLGGILLFSIVSLAIFCGGLYPPLCAFLTRLFPVGIRDRLITLSEGLAAVLWKGIAGWRVIWTSVIFQLLNILLYVLLAHALFLPLSFFDMLAVVPLVTLLTMLPISLNGIGLREGGFVLFLSRIGVEQAEALSLSVLFYGIILLLSLIGALCFFLSHQRKGDL